MWLLKNDNMLSQQQGATVTAFLNKYVLLFFDSSHIQRLDSSFSIMVTWSVIWEGMLWMPVEKVILLLLCNVFHIRINHKGSSLLMIFFFLHTDIFEVTLS